MIYLCINQKLDIMRRVLVMLTLFAAVSITGCSEAAKSVSEEQTKFKFAYFTDIHLDIDDLEREGERDSLLRVAIREVKKAGVDFILFGGDNFAADRRGRSAEDSVRLCYKRMLRVIEEEGVPVRHTVGNHDRYYFYKGEPSKLGFETYQELVNPELYYTFEHKGMHFISMNGAELTDGGEYYKVRKEQREWLKHELESIGKSEPIILSIHVPLMSLYHLAIEGEASVYSTIINSKEIVDILEPYNVKVVIQGHNHIHEEIFVRDRWFVMGGATCGAWPSEVGYMIFEVSSKDSVSWDYVKF